MVGDFQFFKEKTVLPLEMQRVVHIYLSQGVLDRKDFIRYVGRDLDDAVGDD